MANTIDMHSKFTISTKAKEFPQVVDFYKELISENTTDYPDISLSVTVNGKDFSEEVIASLTDDSVLIEAQGIIFSLSPDMLDLLKQFDETAKYTYSFLGFYDCSGEVIAYSVENGMYITKELTDDVSGQWYMEDDVLIIETDRKKHAALLSEIDDLTRQSIPESQKEQFESFIEDTYDNIIVSWVDWSEDLNILAKYLEELNKLIAPIKDEITVLSYNVRWINVNDMRFATVINENGELKLVVRNV